VAIWLDHRSKVIVQGMTGTEGRKHTNRKFMFGTRIVAGVTPGKGGQSVVFEEDPIPVFNTVAEARHATGANVSVVFVPPAHARAAVLDAVRSGIELVVVITEGIPVKDTAEFRAEAEERGVRVIGPNCPGIISPGRSNVGIIPPNIARAGHIGLVSKSGTLTYQMMFELGDIGFSTCVGIGGDPVIGTTHIDCLRAFNEDPETDCIVLIGEIGGDAEERAADFIAEHVTKPVVAYVAGFTAPEGRTMGHAGAIISGSSGTAKEKIAALKTAGAMVVDYPTEVAPTMKKVLGK